MAVSVGRPASEAREKAGAGPACLPGEGTHFFTLGLDIFSVLCKIQRLDRISVIQTAIRRQGAEGSRRH
jgi:hypothetical protein